MTPENFRLTNLFRKVSSERGFAGEQRLKEVFTKFLKGECCPEWLVGYEVATVKEDNNRGIDCWFFTSDVGKIGVQIKSSDKGRRKAKIKRPRIPVVIVHQSESDEEIFQQAISVVSRERAKYLALRSHQKYD